MSTFSGKNYWGLILGASSGIGLATAKKLASAGMNLVLIYRERRSKEEEVQQEFESMRKLGVEVLNFNADATNAEKIGTLVEEMKSQLGVGKVKVLLHSIAKGNLKLMTPTGEGGSVKYPNGTLSQSDFALTSENMAYSLVPWVNTLLEQQLFADHARVLALTSSGDTRVWKGYAAVAAAKASMEAIIKYIAIEYAHHGINANIIEAGVTVTPSMQLIPGSDEIIDRLESSHPQGRLTQPEDIANTVFMLSLDEANWINGARLVADGGERLL